MDFQGKRFRFDTKVRLGAGGMAEVYLASPREQPDMNVAIKIPLSSLPPEVRDMFLREAEAAQRVSSPHVVQVVDWGDSPPFIAFEYVDATTLADELRTRLGGGAFWSLGELLALYRQLVLGMKAINEQVVHRDLKPENMFLADVIKISDFGIAKYVGEVTRSKTFKGWGSGPYMAPETFKLDAIGWEADQYSLGVIFYEMATLQRPFTGTWDELERQHLYQRPPRLTTVVPELPERLATVVARMLEKRPGDRYSSWDEIDQQIQALEDSVAEPDESQIADDPLARAAAEQLEGQRSQALEQERQREEQETRVRDREALLDYWADELFGRLKDRIDRINESLGEGAILFRRLREQVAGLAQHTCDVRFLKADMNLLLQIVPPEASEDALLWGYLYLKTNRRLWIGNFLLLSDPPPHGNWFQVDMAVSGMMQGGFTPDDRGGGRYRVEGQSRLVIAVNWEGLLRQREERNVISGVNYSEKQLDYDAVIDEVLKILVEDGNADPPPQRRPDDDDWFGRGSGGLLRV